jgi:hypothetical protein
VDSVQKFNVYGCLLDDHSPAGEAYYVRASDFDRLRHKLASLAEAGTGYSQQTMDAMVKERADLQHALLMERGKTEKADADNQRLRDALAEAQRDAARFVWWFTTDPHDWPAALEIPDNATVDDFRKAIDAAMATTSPSAPPPFPNTDQPR